MIDLPDKYTYSTRMMATSTSIKEMKENFFQCSVCLDQFNEPKMLPCLHRYCSLCLQTVIQASNDGTIECPMCKQVCQVPKEGVDGFKTDFHMKSVLEFLNLQKSVNNGDLKECISCSKKNKVFAYCFKCGDFLCEQCYKFHKDSRMLKDHEPNILKLANAEAMNLTLEELSAFTEDPRCHIHVKQQAQLCCSTCRNVPVCVLCTYSKHKGHDLHEVNELASNERILLESKLTEINLLKSRLYELPGKIEVSIGKLSENTAEKTETLKIQHKQLLCKLKDDKKKVTTERENGLMDINNRRDDEKLQIRVREEKELSEVKQKYEEIKKETERKYDQESVYFNAKCDKREERVNGKLKRLDDNLKELSADIDIRTKQQKDELQKISNHCQQIIERYKNFTTITSSIIASKDEWADAQCIPDIREACEPLIQEMKKEFSDIESLSDFIIGDISKYLFDNVTISEHEEPVVKVKGFQHYTKWYIDDITSTLDGKIVITGGSREINHITLLNKRGHLETQHRIKSTELVWLYCCFLCPHKLATACTPGEIGIYDIREGSFVTKDVGDVIGNRPANLKVKCITTDPVNKHIIVGSQGRDIYVFTDQLKYCHSMTLPGVIKDVNDITLHRGNLLVCDYDGEGAYAVSMDGSESKLMYEFSKPDVDESDWSPYNVCTGKKEFIYMLWKAQISGPVKCILVQYSQDGRQLLTTRSVDKDAECLTILDADGEEKVLIATDHTGKVYTYGLLVK
ncbi:uncharacterized protein [Apostichopus japonicus]|uniref:uncharacterized protein isoform X1 n=2 Tax=Stichopus japonicus TaxID=307972 RepID=UPI003AB792E9